MVMKTLKENGAHAVKIILAAVPLIAQQDWTDTIQQHKVSQSSHCSGPPSSLDPLKRGHMVRTFLSGGLLEPAEA